MSAPAEHRPVTCGRRPLALGVLLALTAASCSDVSVTALDVHTVTVSPSEVTVGIGDTLRLQATARDVSGNVLSDRPVAWSSDDPAVATVEGGLVTAIAPGTVPIRASSGGVVGQSTVAVAGPSTIVLAQGTLEFHGMSGTGPTGAQTVGISNGGEAALSGLEVAVSYASDDDPAWLGATLAGTTAPTEVSMRADASELAAGTYAASVAVGAPAAGNAPQVIEVTFVVAEAAPFVRVEPETVSVGIAEGEGNPPLQVVTVTNGGGDGELTGLEATISYAAGGLPDWLEPELNGTTTPAELTLRIVAAGLPSDAVYRADVHVASADTEASGTVEVTFELGEAPPEIDLSATEIDWDIVENDASPPPRTIEIENSGGRTLGGLSANVAYGEGAADGWLQVVIGAAAPTELTATLATTALAPGDYEARISVASEQANNSPQSVAVSLTVAPRASAEHSTITAAPTSRIANGTETSTITVQLRDARGDNMPSGGDDVELTATIGTLSGVSPEGGGRYTATLTSTTAGTATVTGTVNGVAIDDEPTVQFVAGPPATVEIVGGDEQSALVGTLLDDPLQVRVVDANGNPVGEAAVTWTPATGGGSADPTTSETNASGITSTQWTLGTTAGTQSLVASVSGAESATFEATGEGGDPAVVVIIAGNNQGGVVGEALAQELVVEVRDQNGNAVGSGVAVTWQAANGGAAGSASSDTDEEGEATTSWTLGPSPGAQTLIATVAGLDPVTFDATAEAGPPDNIEITGGDGQTGTVGQALASPLQVRVTDTFGNLLSGVPVSWEPAAGSVSAATSSTDASGIASMTWTLGSSPGPQTLEVSAGDADPVTFTATAEVGPPTFVLPEGGNDQTGTVGEALADLLQALVTDGENNPLSGVMVTWAPAPGSGSASPTSMETNPSGIATTTWTLGTTAGSQSLVASVPGAASATFDATAQPGDPATIVAVGGTSQSATIGQALAQLLAVEVRDALGNPVPDVTVTWTPAPGDGSTNEENSLTDVDGVASMEWTLGLTPGLQTLNASVPGLGVVPFSASANPPTMVQSVRGGEQTGPLEVPVTDSENNRGAGTAG